MTDHPDLRRAIGRALSFVVWAAIALAPAAAGAQTESQKKEAKEHYEKATRLYEVEKYAEAIDEYQKVYLLVDDPNMLYNIAQAYRLWGKPDEAVRSYRNFLRRSPNAPNRADVEKKIGDLEKTIEERRRATTTPVPPPVTAPPTTETPPPVVAPVPPPVLPPPTSVQPPPTTVVTMPAEPPADTGKSRRILSYTLLVGGGVFLASAAIAGSVANQKAKELEKMSKDVTQPPFDPSIEKAGRNANKIAIVTGLIGVAAAATGGILLLTSPSPSRSVAVFPVVGPTLAGGGARVTF